MSTISKPPLAPDAPEPKHDQPDLHTFPDRPEVGPWRTFHVHQVVEGVDRVTDVYQGGLTLDDVIRLEAEHFAPAVGEAHGRTWTVRFFEQDLPLALAVVRPDGTYTVTRLDESEPEPEPAPRKLILAIIAAAIDAHEFARSNLDLARRMASCSDWVQLAEAAYDDAHHHLVRCVLALAHDGIGLDAIDAPGFVWEAAAVRTREHLVIVTPYISDEGETDHSFGSARVAIVERGDVEDLSDVD